MKSQHRDNTTLHFCVSKATYKWEDKPRFITSTPNYKTCASNWASALFIWLKRYSMQTLLTFYTIVISPLYYYIIFVSQLYLQYLWQTKLKFSHKMKTSLHSDKGKLFKKKM